MVKLIQDRTAWRDCHLDVGASNDIQIALGYVRQWAEMFAGVGFIGVVFDRK